MRKSCPFLWLCFGFIFCTIFSTTPILAADNLLLNPDFEEWNGNTPSSWDKSASFPTEISTQSKNGTRSALLKTTTGSYRYLHQTIKVAPNTPYRFSGFVKQISGKHSISLRLAWYCTGCTQQSGTPDESNLVDKILNDFSEISLEVASPADAASVQTRIFIKPLENSTDNSVLVDNLTFTQIAALPSEQENSIVATTAAPSPFIDFSSPNEAVVGEPFKISFSLKNFDPETEYFIKARGGPNENSLTKIQTRSGNVYLSDNDKWDKFPVVKTNKDGSLNTEVIGSLDEEETSTKYKIQLCFKTKTKTRICSGFREITFFEAPSGAEALAKATQELPKPATPSVSLPTSIVPPLPSKPSLTSTPSGSTLGTQSAIISPPANSSTSAIIVPSKPSPPSTPSSSKKSSTNAFISQSLIMLGLLFSAIGLFRFSKKSS